MRGREWVGEGAGWVDEGAGLVGGGRGRGWMRGGVGG